MPRSSSTRHRSTTRSGAGPISPVSWTSRSVPPAIGRCGAPARIAYASASVRGETTGGSTGIAGPRSARARAPAERGELDRVDDLRVARAAAQVAGDGLADGAVGRLGPAGEERLGGHQHPRRADPALGTACDQERVLQVGQPATGAGETLDGAHDRAVDLAHRDQAAHDGLTVDQHGAGAALALAATLLGPGEAEVLAQDVEQASHARHRHLRRLAVDDQAERHAAGAFDTADTPGAQGFSVPVSAARIRSGVAGRSSIQAPVASWIAA